MNDRKRQQKNDREAIDELHTAKGSEGEMRQKVRGEGMWG